MSQPGTTKRARLVDYSDSETEPSSPSPSPSPDPATPGPAPETENELARIVIRLQEKYIREYEHLEARQDDMARRLEDWKGGVEERIRMELQILKALVKRVFDVDLNEVLGQEDVQRVSMGEVSARRPPSPSLTPPVEVHQQLSSSQSVVPAVMSSPAPHQPVFDEDAPSSDDENPRPAANVPSRSRMIRISVPGKKATRPKPAEPTSRSDQTLTGASARAEPAIQNAETPAESNSTIHDPTPAHGATIDSPSQAAAGPASPYDNPKYFSPLTVRDKDGRERPIFKFYPHPSTVKEQWAEYRYGLHGQPPVEQLEAKYQAKWRSGSYARSWFTRRKTFWDKIKDMLAEGKTEAEALSAMEERAEGGVPNLIGALCKERTGKSTGKSTEPARKRKRGLGARKKQMASDSSEEDDFVVSDSDSDGASQRSYKPKARKELPRQVPSEDPPKSRTYTASTSPYVLLRKRMRLAEREAGHVDE